MKKMVNNIFWIVVALLALTIFGVVVRDGSTILADLGQHIMQLFKKADLDPNDSRGFSCFIQLILIAIFTGWAIRKFMDFFSRDSKRNERDEKNKGEYS